MNRLRQNALPLLLVLAAQLALASALWRGHTLLFNRLEGGHWLSTKTTLERGLSGSHNFLNGRQSVAGQRLNLGAWYGFQEIIYRKQLKPARIECSFVLHAKAHLSLIFNKTEGGFSGVRISLDQDRPSMLFVASAVGEFQDRTPIVIPRLEPRTEHRLAAAFSDGAVDVAIDGTSVGRFPARLADRQQVGFRGGGRPAILDNIVIQEQDSSSTLLPAATMYESFDSTGTWKSAILALGLVLLVNLAFVALRFSRPGASGRRTLLAAIVANGTLAAMAASLVLFFWYRADRYPAADSALRAGENAWKISQADEIREAIRQRYGNPDPEGVLRVLLLGTSQAWGAGAAHSNEIITAVLERMLNERETRGRRYECINGGISAVDSAFLLDLYEREWIDLRPRLVVVDLSNNDTDAVALQSNLQRIAQLNRTAGIRTLFVQEPTSSEVRSAELGEIAVRHSAMKAAGDLEGVPVLDMHGFLLANQDRGFLFWDPVHLTSLGQRLFAERLYPEVRHILDEMPQVSRGDVAVDPKAPSK